MTVSAPLCVFPHRGFYLISTAFTIIDPWKNKAIDNQMLSKWYCIVDQNFTLFSAFIISSIFASSPTPLSEMQHQTMTGPPPCFTGGCEHSLLYLSLDFLHKYWWLFESDIPELDSSLYCHWFLLQFLCNLEYLSFFSLFLLLKNGFFTVTLSLRPFLLRLQWRVNYRLRLQDCMSQIVCQVVAGFSVLSFFFFAWLCAWLSDTVTQLFF